ncbi:MAG: hypothetical protein U9Q62_00720 [Campylobacterota bacterium]|nr:hypothetical protein [Campylobacterota bacterium]
MSQLKENYGNFTWALSALNAMIDETMYHTQTFAHTLKVHHNDKAAKVFFLACEQFKTEQEIVVKHAQNIDLPMIPPWETPYPEYQHPSSLLIHADYLMTEAEARKIIGAMIGIHNSFYDILLKENRVEKVVSLVDQLVKYNEQCETKNKEEKIMAEAKQFERQRDLDLSAIESIFQ